MRFIWRIIVWTGEAGALRELTALGLSFPRLRGGKGRVERGPGKRRAGPGAQIESWESRRTERREEGREGTGTVPGAAPALGPGAFVPEAGVGATPAATEEGPRGRVCSA